MNTQETSPYPEWIRFIRASVGALSLDSNPPRQRAVISLPVLELSAGIATFLAVRHFAIRRSTNPLDNPTSAMQSKPASYFGSGRYEDVQILDVENDIPRLQYSGGTVSLGKYPDVIRQLPESFERRSSHRKISQSTLSAWKTVERFDVSAGRIHARVSAMPILFIGSRGALEADLEVLSGLFPSPPEFCDIGSSLSSWFRHPVIAVGPQIPQDRDWLGDVTPSLVILVGAAAWHSNLRRIFWDAPHMLLLDRRSQTAVGIASEIELSQPIFSEVDLDIPRGIEATWFSDPPLIAGDFDDEEFE
jgi:hypothetical protein